MLKKTLIFSLLLFAHLTDAAIRLPGIVSSHMVLQRQTTVQLWGWADEGEKISINCSWLNEEQKVIADNDGRWQVEVVTTDSKAPQHIHLKSKDSDIELEDILFGEVWLCSGQSNMYQPMNGYRGQPTYGTLKALSEANRPDIRLFTVKNKASKEAQDTLMGYQGWQAASPASVLKYSAIAYYFACQLQDFLDVPVGMIHTSWGGSNVQAWMSKECISDFETLDLEGKDLTKAPNRIATLLYNAMIHPLIPYTIKGALWYQGESNRLEPELYRDYFPAMVKDWRSRWGIGDFPFYYVQIAPYHYETDTEEIYNTFKNTAFIREAQQACLAAIPHSGMVVTMDIGDQFSIHPPKKQEVAERLFYQAIRKTYGYKAFVADGPVYSTMKAKDGALLLHFKHADMGLYAYQGLSGFEIAGDDHVFYPAEATIHQRNQVLVKSPHVSHPVAVRYCWRNWAVGSLYNNYLLPAPSFRTDDWDDATRVVQ